MAKFSYKGRNRSGELVSGDVEAASMDGVANQLSSGNITPISIKEVVTAEAFEMPRLFKPGAM